MTANPGRPGGFRVSGRARFGLLALVLATAAVAWLVSPVYDGYHLGSCSSADYFAATGWALRNVGPGSEGRVLRVRRVFAWCKADEKLADYSPVRSATARPVHRAQAGSAATSSTSTGSSTSAGTASAPSSGVTSNAAPTPSAAANPSAAGAPGSAPNAPAAAPLQVSCPRNARTGAIHNHRSPTWCFWSGGTVGNGLPPNPEPGAYDPQYNCTWQESGTVNAGTAEVYTCE